MTGAIVAIVVVSLCLKIRGVYLVSVIHSSRLKQNLDTQRIFSDDNKRKAMLQYFKGVVVRLTYNKGVAGRSSKSKSSGRNGRQRIFDAAVEIVC